MILLAQWGINAEMPVHNLYCLFMNQYHSSVTCFTPNNCKQHYAVNLFIFSTPEVNRDTVYCGKTDVDSASKIMQ